MLQKDPANGVLGGVCVGLSDFFDLDPLIFRLAFVFSVVFFGIGFIPYIILWLLMPVKK